METKQTAKAANEVQKMKETFFMLKTIEGEIEKRIKAHEDVMRTKLIDLSNTVDELAYEVASMIGAKVMFDEWEKNQEATANEGDDKNIISER